jgi:hypothetical protein
MGPKVKISWSSPACVGSMPVQVWHSTFIYFPSYDDLNPLHSCMCGEHACASVAFNIPIFSELWSLKHMHLVFATSSTSQVTCWCLHMPKEQRTFHISNQECMLVGDDAATCCMVEDVSLGTSYGSLAVLLHTGASSLSDSVLYKWNYLAAAPCVLISMSNA